MSGGIEIYKTVYQFVLRVVVCECLCLLIALSCVKQRIMYNMF